MESACSRIFSGFSLGSCTSIEHLPVEATDAVLSQTRCVTADLEAARRPQRDRVLVIHICPGRFRGSEGRDAHWWRNIREPLLAEARDQGGAKTRVSDKRGE